MSQHEKFEAAWSAEYPLHSTTTFKRSGFNSEAYANTRVQDGWLMWQASHRAALEEAWAICNANSAKLKGMKETESGYVALVLTADDIRALAKETNNG